MLNFMLSEKNVNEEFNSLFSKLKQIGEQSAFVDLILKTIENWRTRFSLLFSRQAKLQQKNNIHLFQNKYILLNDILNQLKSQIKNPRKNIEKYFQAYPILKEIPNEITFIYYFRKQNFQKVKQIAENIIQFNKDCLEEITSQLEYLQTRWDKNNSNLFEKQKSAVLKFFLASFQKRLNHKKPQSIQKYWEFYSMCFRTDRYFFKKLELKEQVISSLKYIIEYFTFLQLSTSNKVYIQLFVSLKLFLEEQNLRADEFLEQFQKKKLIEELKGNKKLLCDFIRVFPFYQMIAGKYYLHRTKLFDHILSTKMLNWLFYQSPLFFSNTLNAKIFEKKQNEAFNLIIFHTKYLSSNELINGKSYYIFINLIKQNSENHHEMILFFLQLGLSTFRQNNYLSSFVLMIYLFFESKILNDLKFLQIKRVYTLSAISVDKLPEIRRIQLRKVIKYKFRNIFQKLKPRKKRILNRQEDYSRNCLFFLKKESLKIIDQKKIFNRKLEQYFQSHFKKLKSNFPNTRNLQEKKSSTSLQAQTIDQSFK